MSFYFGILLFEKLTSFQFYNSRENILWSINRATKRQSSKTLLLTSHVFPSLFAPTSTKALTMRQHRHVCMCAPDCVNGNVWLTIIKLHSSGKKVWCLINFASQTQYYISNKVFHTCYLNPKGEGERKGRKQEGEREGKLISPPLTPHPTFPLTGFSLSHASKYPTHYLKN